jgi:hypothetical protein
MDALLLPAEQSEGRNSVKPQLACESSNVRKHIASKRTAVAEPPFMREEPIIKQNTSQQKSDLGSLPWNIKKT